jgi:hypothetical protein
MKLVVAWVVCYPLDTPAMDELPTKKPDGKPGGTS